MYPYKRIFLLLPILVLILLSLLLPISSAFSTVIAIDINFVICDVVCIPLICFDITAAELVDFNSLRCENRRIGYVHLILDLRVSFSPLT